MEDTKKLIFVIGSRSKSNLLLKYLLINGGYKVLLLDYSPNILKYIEEELPALLMFDYMQSKSDWFVLLKEVKENNITKMIPIIVMLQRADRDLVPKLYEQGADHIIYKPLSREDTLDEVKGILIKSEKNKNNLLSRVGFEGNLKDMSVIEVIQTLDINEKTGILRITSGDDVGYIYFFKGKMQKAKALNLKDELAIFRIMQWRDGIFIFQNKTHGVEKTIKKADQEIVLEGVQRLDDISRFLSEIGGERVIPVSATIKDSSIFMDLPQLQKTLYLKLDGAKEIREYIRYTSVGDFEIVSAFLELYKKELISFKAPVRPMQDSQIKKKRMKDIFKNAEDIFFNKTIKQ